MACSSTIFISDASPFGWTIGTCDPRPVIVDLESPCYCQSMNIADNITIQVEYDGAGTPELRVIDDDTGAKITVFDFNIVRMGHLIAPVFPVWLQF